ncbi:hypothetical protein LINGRAHAP2_LOCUS4978, partial [Linum grandiflorum]
MNILMATVRSMVNGHDDLTDLVIKTLVGLEKQVLAKKATIVTPNENPILTTPKNLKKRTETYKPKRRPRP